MKKSSFLLLFIFPFYCFSEHFVFVTKQELCVKIIEILESGEEITCIVPRNEQDMDGYDFLIVYTGEVPDFDEIDIAD